jgi:hypothetical protein
MAFHESHERLCPFCKARMSATAPKCLNCGRLVDEEEDDTPDRPPTKWGLLVGIVFGLVAAALIAYVLRGRKNEPPPEDADTQEIHRIMAERLDLESLNERSGTAWAEFEPELRVGRPFKDLLNVIWEREAAPPGTGTLIATNGYSHSVFLKDATVHIRLDREENIQSWERRRPGPLTFTPESD